MELDALPVWGDMSLTVIFLTVSIWFVISIMRGTLVPKSTLDETRKVADTFKVAWETERTRTDQVVRYMEELRVVGENMERVINALPVDPDKGDNG